MGIERKPHALSALFNVDPAYSAEMEKPERGKNSLLSENKSGPFWIYLFGDIATHLFNRMRREAFAVCRNICHPGEFRNFRPTLYAKRTVQLPEIPGKAVFNLFCSGHVTLKVNGTSFFLNHAFPAKPEACVIDLLPYLKIGDNHMLLIVQSLGEPAAFLIQGDLFETDSKWIVSSDYANWFAPDLIPFEGVERFPHQEELPELVLKAKPIGDGIYDFGTESFGRPLITIKGQGDLELYVGESVPESLADDPLVQEQSIPPLAHSIGTYLCGANLSLRYIRLIHPPTLHVEEVKLSAPFYPARYKGAFACSDDTLTKIWMRSAYTLKLCMRWLCVDGLKRDRLPWGGDMYMSGLVNNYSFHDRAFMQRSLIALYGESPEALDINNIADYTFFWILTLRDNLMHFGDRQFLKRVIPLLKRMLNVLESRIDANGFIPTREGVWVFIDWSKVEKKGYSSCIQMLYVMALDASAEIYHFLGEPEHAADLRKRAQKLRVKCGKAFWSEEFSAYVDNIVDGIQGRYVSRPANIFAMLSGTANRGRMRSIVRNVFLNKDIKAVGTPYMRAFEALALSRCGEADAMLSIIREDWGGMIKAGATTFWEGYDKSQSGIEQYGFYGRPFGKSLCHAWSAGPVYLLSCALTGARSLAPGWERFTLAPRSNGLDWVSVSIPCPQGEIMVEIEGESVSVSVPKGAVFVEDFESGEEREYQGPCIVEMQKTR